MNSDTPLPHPLLLTSTFIQPSLGWNARALSFDDVKRIYRIQSLQRLTEKWLSLIPGATSSQDWIQQLKITSQLRLPTHTALRSDLLSDLTRIESELLDEKPTHETLLRLHGLAWRVQAEALLSLSKTADDKVISLAAKQAGADDSTWWKDRYHFSEAELTSQALFQAINSEETWIGSDPHQHRPAPGFFLIRRRSADALQLDLIDPLFESSRKEITDAQKRHSSFHLDWLQGWTAGLSAGRFALTLDPRGKFPVRLTIQRVPSPQSRGPLS